MCNKMCTLFHLNYNCILLNILVTFPHCMLSICIFGLNKMADIFPVAANVGVIGTQLRCHSQMSGCTYSADSAMQLIIEHGDDQCMVHGIDQWCTGMNNSALN